jgi:Ca-activated chloride channel family protein
VLGASEVDLGGITATANAAQGVLVDDLGADHEDVSKLIVHPLVDNLVALNKTSDDFRWSASVAAFGMLLRESEYVKNFSYDQVVQLAQGAKGEDKEGYRIEFINMAKSFGSIAKR